MQTIPELSTGLPEARNRKVLKYLQVAYDSIYSNFYPHQ